MKRAGLSDEEVKISRELYGDNSLTEKKKEGFFQKLLENFGDPMIKILIVALMLNTVFVILHYAAGRSFERSPAVVSYYLFGYFYNMMR